MADDKKVKKTKKKKEEEAAPAEAAPAAAPPPAEAAPAPVKKASTKKAKRTGSANSMFSEKKIQEFKEAFMFMDMDKDEVIGVGDLRATFDAIGRMPSEKELNELINEAPGKLDFQGLIGLFAARMSGSADDDDVVINAFKCFDDGGKIDSEKLRHALMTWGEKFTSDEWDDASDQMVVDGSGKIDTKALIQMLTASGGDDEEEEEA